MPNAQSDKTYLLITSMGGGGAERQVSSIYQISEIDLLLCIERENVYDIPPEKIKFLTDTKATGSVIGKLKQIVTTVIALKKLGVNRHTHLLCFLQLPFIIGNICKFLFRCKVTISIRYNPFGFNETSKDRSIPLALLKYLLNRVDLIVPNSISTATQLRSFLKKGQTVIPVSNGYNLEEIQMKAMKPVPHYVDLLTKYDCLLSVGRLSAEKGHRHLLRIFKGVKNTTESRDVKLIIVGTGVLKEELSAQARTLGLKTFVYESSDSFHLNYDVYFLGFQSNPYFFYTHATLFLFPSLYEGLPNALIESFLCRLSAVSADCNSGPREIMLPEKIESKELRDVEESPLGYLIKAFDPTDHEDILVLNTIEELWIKTILEFLTRENSLQKISLSTHQHISERYSLKTTLQHWKAILS